MSDNISGVIHLIEMTVYDASIPGTRVLRIVSGAPDYHTAPTDSPVSAEYLPYTAKLPTMERSAYDGGGTMGKAASASYGDLELVNDGSLDTWIDYGFDGRDIVVKQGNVGAAFSTFTVKMTAKMEQPEITRDKLVVKLRGFRYLTDVAFQATKFAGSNTLPNGVEGTADDIKGHPKPMLYGANTNVTCPCVNTSKNIYLARAGALTSVQNVYDKGMPLSVGFPFILRTSPLTQQLRAVCYGNGTWVAGGDNGELATSTDNGVTWTSRTSGMGASQVTSCAYGAGLFVITGSGGEIRTSPDGITWTGRTSTFGGDVITEVKFHNSLFVAVGANGKMSTSPDGITWTSRTSGFGADTIYGVTWGNGLWVAVGNLGELTTSPDAITWTARTSGVSTHLVAATFANNQYIAVGYSGVFLSSFDGITWSPRPSPSGTGVDIYGVSYGNGIFLAAGISGTAASAPDGANWTKRTSAFAASDIIGEVGYGNGVFVLVGQGGKIASTTVSGGTYASEADLLNDALAPAAGTYKVYLAGGMIRLGESPQGTVTASVTEGATAADRTLAQIAKRILTERAGISAGNISSADITALDTANSSEVAIAVMSEETTVSAVLDKLLASDNVMLFEDRAGLWRIQRLEAPSGTPVLDIPEYQLANLERVVATDIDKGVPPWRVNMEWGENYTVQNTDLAAGVTPDRRAFLGKAFRAVQQDDSAVKTAHLLAPELPVTSCFITEAAATTAALRQLNMRKTRRDRFEVTIEGLSSADVLLLDINKVIKLTHTRFGLSAGKLFRVMRVADGDSAGMTHLTVWG